MRLLKTIYRLFTEPKLYKVLSETNKLRFVSGYSESEVRLEMYQTLRGENFTIKLI